MDVVASGVSQKPFCDMMLSISLSLISLASMSKIPFQIFEFLFEIFEGLLEFDRHGGTSFGCGSILEMGNTRLFLAEDLLP